MTKITIVSVDKSEWSYWFEGGMSLIFMIKSAIDMFVNDDHPNPNINLNIDYIKMNASEFSQFLPNAND